MKQHITIAQKRTLVKNPILIEGITRAGKFLLGNILDGFDRVDHYKYVSLLEHLPFLERLGLISEEVAVSLLQVNIDENAYNMQIGRNLNLRSEDKSSLIRSFKKKEYIQRTLMKDDTQAIDHLKKGNCYSVFIIHEGMPNIKIFFKSFPKLKIISLQRHPVDIIYSWDVRGWGKREMLDPLSLQPCIRIGRRAMPWYAYRVSERYPQLNQMDRVIKIIMSLFEMSSEAVRTLTAQQRKKILFITYEDLVINTFDVIEQIGVFLKTKPLSIMPKILKREHCPNREIHKNRKQKLQDIRGKASKKVFQSLMNLIGRYEEYNAHVLLPNSVMT